MLLAGKPVSWHACLDCPPPVISRHMALDGASEYSGHRTLRGVDHSPELLACAALKQCLGAALQCHRCNKHANLHPTTHVGAICSCFAPAVQVLHTRASCTYSFHRSYIASKTAVAQRGNLYKHAQPPAHKLPPNLGYHL